MGIYYYIVNIADETIYEFGKGMWYEFDVETLFDKELLYDHIYNDIYDTPSKDFTEYLKRIVEDLFEKFKDVDHKKMFVINDCEDDIYYFRCLKYKFIGTRYYLGVDIEKYNYCMESLNRHLVDNDWTKRHYNKQNIPQWFYDKYKMDKISTKKTGLSVIVFGTKKS